MTHQEQYCYFFGPQPQGKTNPYYFPPKQFADINSRCPAHYRLDTCLLQIFNQLVYITMYRYMLHILDLQL